MKKVIKIFMMVVMGLFINSCYYDYIPDDDFVPIDGEEVPEVSYVNEIVPLWEEDCVQCHDGVIPPDLRNNVSYDELLDGYVVPGNADESILYKSLLGIDGVELMPPGAIWPDEKITLVRNWINQGALNN
jgi:hypothetical protein